MKYPDTAKIEKIMGLAFERLGIPYNQPNSANEIQAEQVIIMHEVMRILFLSFLAPKFNVDHRLALETVRALLDALELMYDEAGL